MVNWDNLSNYSPLYKPGQKLISNDKHRIIEIQRITLNKEYVYMYMNGPLAHNGTYYHLFVEVDSHFTLAPGQINYNKIWNSLS